eukprot:5321-Pelagomonas_calceolata.AAC.1
MMFDDGVCVVVSVETLLLSCTLARHTECMGVDNVLMALRTQEAQELQEAVHSNRHCPGCNGRHL